MHTLLTVALQLQIAKLHSTHSHNDCQHWPQWQKRIHTSVTLSTSITRGMKTSVKVTSASGGSGRSRDPRSTAGSIERSKHLHKGAQSVGEIECNCICLKAVFQTLAPSVSTAPHLAAQGCFKGGTFCCTRLSMHTSNSHPLQSCPTAWDAA